MSVRVGDSSRRNEEIVKISNCAFHYDDDDDDDDVVVDDDCYYYQMMRGKSPNIF